MLCISGSVYEGIAQPPIMELAQVAVMRVGNVTAERRGEWNAFVAQEPSFALLQSWEWGEFKEKLGWRAYRIAVEEEGQILAGAQMLIKHIPLGLGSVAYVPRGPVGEWLDMGVTTKLLCAMLGIAGQHRAVFLKMEPPQLHDSLVRGAIERHGFRASPLSNQPRASIIVDLAQDLDHILNGMSKNTRRKIRDAARKGVTVRFGSEEDLAAFYELMRITGRRRSFSVRRFDYYKNEFLALCAKQQAALLMAFYQGKLLAAHMAFCFGKHAAFFHQASSSDLAALNPNSLLVWEAAKWAKALGCCTYDLWGIPDEVGAEVALGGEPPESDRTDGLWGAYRFKKLFSKNIVFYVGAYDYVYRPALYALITSRLFSASTLDRGFAWMDWLTSF
jgi:lipid II:glycine glycyltransferase (peptidoglycan interpeptide bridge formation enzyme)